MTFGVPLFLVAALAGAIPVLLHMINRQNAPVMPFSTLRFLQVSVQKTRRRKYIHDILLLVLRVAALVLLAVGLARPALHQLHGWFGGTAATSVAVILDNSASMATADQTGSRWQRATRAVEQIFDTLRDGDHVALLTSNGPPVLPSRTLFQDHELVRQALATCRSSFERADLAATLDEARRLLAKSTAANKEIYVVTDMQATSWRELKTPEVSDKQTAAPVAPVIMIDISGPTEPNAALAKIQVQATAPVAGVPMQVSVDVQGDTEVVEQRHVALYVDDRKQAASPTLNIEPGQVAHHAFHIALRAPGLRRGDVRLDGKDACAADDRLFFAANIDPAIPIAVLKAEQQEVPFLDQAYYLERALAPEGGSRGAFQVRSLTTTDAEHEPLDPFVVVFCVDLPAPDGRLAEKLANYVTNGGNLVWICGTHVDPVNYSAVNDQVGGGLLPIRMTGLQQAGAERPDGWHIGWIDADDPILGPFHDPPGLYQSVLVYQYVQMPPLTGSGVRVLAKLDDGQPLLVEKNMESGRVFLLATSMHVQWTNLPLRPLFLPLVARLVFQLAGTSVNRPMLIAGSPWTLPTSGHEDTSVEIVRPGGDVVRINRTADDKEAGPIRFTDTHAVGVYEARIRRAGQALRTAFAVNPDPEESAPARVEPGDLESRLGAVTTVVFCHDPDNVARVIQRLRQGQSLWEFFLLVVLFALVAEAFLSNRRALNADRLDQGPRPIARKTKRRVPVRKIDLPI